MKVVEQIKKPIYNEMDLFEKKFTESMSSKVALLNRITHFIVNRKGKQMRPMFVFLVAKLLGKGNVNERTYRGASVIELIHTATLVHDDVVDGAETRRARQAVCRIWGNESSVLSGDYLFAMAFYLLTKMRNKEVLSLMSATTTRMACAELSQLTSSFGTSDEEYFEIIINKTACLFAAAIKTGALLAGGSLDSADRLYEYGMALGIAFQIVDDALDYTYEYKTGKPVGGDLQERKITLPLRHLLKKANPSDRRRLDKILSNQEIEKHHVDEVVNMMKNYNSIQYTLDCSKNYSLDAQRSLEKFPESSLRQTLFELADFVVSREI